MPKPPPKHLKSVVELSKTKIIGKDLLEKEVANYGLLGRFDLCFRPECFDKRNNALSCTTFILEVSEGAMKGTSSNHQLDGA